MIVPLSAEATSTVVGADCSPASSSSVGLAARPVDGGIICYNYWFRCDLTHTHPQARTGPGEVTGRSQAQDAIEEAARVAVIRKPTPN
jgi:hypothetical protein